MLDFSTSIFIVLCLALTKGLSAFRLGRRTWPILGPGSGATMDCL